MLAGLDNPEPQPVVGVSSREWWRWGGLNNGAKSSVAEDVAKGLLHQMVVELEASGAGVTSIRIYQSAATRAIGVRGKQLHA